MSRRYRITRPQDHRCVLLATASAATGGVACVLTGAPTLVVVGLVLLAAGPAAALRCHRRTGTVLALLPGLVTVDRWSLPWPAVSKVIVFEAPPGQPTLLGAQLRSVDHLPEDVPATQLDQTTPVTPIVLSSVDSDRVDVDRLVTAFRRIHPTDVTLVRQRDNRQTRLDTPIL
jgi:hypothetical protein